MALERWGGNTRHEQEQKHSCGVKRPWIHLLLMPGWWVAVVLQMHTRWNPMSSCVQPPVASRVFVWQHVCTLLVVLQAWCIDTAPWHLVAFLTATPGRGGWNPLSCCEHPCTVLSQTLGCPQAHATLHVVLAVPVCVLVSCTHTCTGTCSVRRTPYLLVSVTGVYFDTCGVVQQFTSGPADLGKTASVMCADTMLVAPQLPLAAACRCDVLGVWACRPAASFRLWPQPEPGPSQAVCYCVWHGIVVVSRSSVTGRICCVSSTFLAVVSSVLA